MSTEFTVEVPSPCLNVYRNVFDGRKFIEMIEILSKEEWPRLSWERSSENRHNDPTAFVSDYRSSLGMSLIPIWQTELRGELMDVRKELESILSAIDKCVWDYRNSYDLSLTSDEPMSVLKYTVGTEYRTHWDSGPQNGRVLSLVCYVNDDYEGGELDFPVYGVTVKPTAGTVVLFPSGFQHKHAARPVTAGTKYSLVTWLK